MTDKSKDKEEEKCTENLETIAEDKEIEENAENKTESGEEVNVQKKLDEKTAECASYLDKYQRTMAEFDNFRKRTTKEKADMYDLGVMETVEKIVPMIDNFERALQQLNKEDSNEAKVASVVEGINMIYNQFMDTLKAIGVLEMDCKGKPFDPNLHNAVMHAQDESFGENEVADVFQKGYMYGDKVIRHAMVKVVN